MESDWLWLFRQHDVIIGPLIRTAAYVCLAYSVGSSPEFALAFLANLSRLVLSLVLLAGAALVASGGSAVYDSTRCCLEWI
jgi:hypothetical protein